MLSSTNEPRVYRSVVCACALALVLTMTAAPTLAASAVEVDLGAIDTLPPAKGGSAVSPIELTPPAAIRAEIARREAARRAADRRAATQRAALERKQAAAARKQATARRAEADREEARQRKMAAQEKARKERAARAAGRPKELQKTEPRVAVAKSANKSESVAPPAAGKPSAGDPAPLTAKRAPSAGKTRITFAKGSTQLSAAAKQNMAPVIRSLSQNAKTRLVIYAYAGGKKARRLSLSRALAVRRHLIKAGIEGTRAEVRALGATTTEKPLDRADLVLVGQ